MNERPQSIPENKMGVMPVNKLLLSMSIPIMLSMSTQALYNVVDSIFVAQLGEDALNAVALSYPIQFLIIAIAIGTCVGVNAVLSKSLGEKNFERANRSASTGLLLVWLSWLVFLAIGLFGARSYFAMQTDDPGIIRYGTDYLSVVCIFSLGTFTQNMMERLLISTGKTVYTMISQFVGTGINIGLCPILIFGLLGFPRLEVKGAAIAAVSGQIAAALLSIYFNLRKNHEIRISFTRYGPNLDIVKRVYKVGLPAILMNATGSVMTYFMNMILLSFTTTATAVYGVYFRLQTIAFMPTTGFNNGLIPIIAYNYGAKNKERLMKAVKLATLYSLITMLVALAVFELFPEQLLHLFNADAHMIEIGVPALRIMSTQLLFSSFCIIFISAFQALGRGIESLVVIGTRQLIVLIPVAWLLSLTRDLNAVWWANLIAETVTVTLCFIFAKRIYEKVVRPL